MEACTKISHLLSLTSLSLENQMLHWQTAFFLSVCNFRNWGREMGTQLQILLFLCWRQGPTSTMLVANLKDVNTSILQAGCNILTSLLAYQVGMMVAGGPALQSLAGWLRACLSFFGSNWSIWGMSSSEKKLLFLAYFVLCFFWWRILFKECSIEW